MKQILEKLKNSKKAKLIVACALCAVIAIVYFLPSNSNNSNNKEQTVINNNTDESNEARLETVLSNIKGAGKVRVMITYTTGNEIVTARSSETQTNTVTEKNSNGSSKESRTVVESSSPVTVGSGNGENALVVVEKQPEIKGVIVVAQGANNIDVKLRLQKAVETVLQISPTQVEIFAMN